MGNKVEKTQINPNNFTVLFAFKKPYID